MRVLHATLAVAMILVSVLTADARMVRGIGLDELATRAGRIFRARCVGAEPGTAEIAGAALAVTTYTFEVSDPLKRSSTGPLVFRQVGTPAGGAHDLGARVGLPVYRPGVEYVLFLLPESAAGLTSPAGAGDGAFRIDDERVVPMSAAVSLVTPTASGARSGPSAPTAAASSLPYDAFRSRVRSLVTP